MMVAYPPSMIPNEFAGETIQSHRNLSGGRLDNRPSSTVKWACKFGGRVLMACLHVCTSDSFRILGVDSESAREAGEMRMKWGNSPSRSGFGIDMVVRPSRVSIKIVITDYIYYSNLSSTFHIKHHASCIGRTISVSGLISTPPTFDVYPTPRMWYCSPTSSFVACIKRSKRVTMPKDVDTPTQKHLKEISVVWSRTTQRD
jgi:hypothetical protein